MDGQNEEVARHDLAQETVALLSVKQFVNRAIPAGGIAVNRPDKVTSGGAQLRPVFVSYATADRKVALSVCNAIENRGAQCWISCRDVEPGENYQEAIFRAIQNASAMVLVFSEAANNSNEIKKELSLASRFNVTVIALRIEDVEPSNAFAYELSTRQWIDAFEGWDHSLDALVLKLGHISSGTSTAALESNRPKHRRARIGSSPRKWAGVGIAVLLVVGAVTTVFWNPFAKRERLTVEIGSVQALSGVPSDAPAAFQQALADAFGDDNAVQIKDKDATYTLSGTIRNTGNLIEYATRLTDTHSGEMLWSASREFDIAAGSAGPQQAAAAVSWVVRCGLADAMESPRPLSERALALYLLHCQLSSWQGAPTRALDVARQVVQLAPNFSKGWSRLAFDEGDVAASVAGDQKSKLIDAGNDAVRRALMLDPRNGNAYLSAAILTPSNDWARREMMLRRSVEVTESDCGCEHEHYAFFLLDLGRPTEAVVQAQRAVDMQPTSPSALDVLAIANYSKGDVGAADQVIKSRTSFWKASPGSKEILLFQAIETKRWNDAATAAKNLLTEPTQLPLVDAFAALASGDPNRIAAARVAVTKMPADDSTVEERVEFLSAIGDTKDALALLKPLNSRKFPGASFLLDPQLTLLRKDPSWVGLLQERGLIDYWRTAKKPPELCKTVDAPTFCQTI